MRVERERVKTATGRRGAFRATVAVAAAAVILLPVLSFAVRSTSYYRPGWNLFSPSQDVQVGQQAEQQELRKLSINKDSEANNYITQLGKKLAGHMPGPEFPFRFHIVNDKAINAFALPGGAIFINTGAICAASNEAQLAGVMAHEESHVALRHSTSAASKQEAVSLPLGVLGAALGSGTGGSIARLATQMAATGYFLHYSRGMESQADALGAQVMNDTGYDPHYMAQFFETLQKQGGHAQTAQFLSDHPNPGNRVKAVDAEIPTLAPQSSYHNDSSEFHNVQSRLCGGTSRPFAAEAPAASGNAINSASESRGGDQATIQFQGIRLSYPASWKAYGGDTSEMTLVPKDGLASQGQQTSVIRGVIVSTYDPPHRGNVDQGTQELIEQLRQSNPQLRAISGEHQPVQAAGITGDSVQLVNKNAQGSTEQDDLLTFPRSDGSLLYLIFIAPQSEYGKYNATFEQILSSVKISQ